mgnify:CR=1 FL=1
MCAMFEPFAFIFFGNPGPVFPDTNIASNQKRKDLTKYQGIYISCQFALQLAIMKKKQIHTLKLTCHKCHVMSTKRAAAICDALPPLKCMQP